MRPVALVALALALALLMAACGAQSPPSPSASPPLASASPAASATATPAAGGVLPAPGSSSVIFAPDPSAIVVAVEAGHGGCLDWGVPDPRERGPEYAEKAITMGIARQLADLLAADGVTPVLVRDGDEALAGDFYPPLDCDGEPFRDVNGDGLAGFGSDELPEATRTRDELQARLDRANLAMADVLVSIHVDSITDGAGNLLPIARTETFYTDETPWGVPASERLAAAVQASVVAAMDAVAGYERQDRGTSAHNLYIVAPPLAEPTPDRPDPLRQPTRGALMPAILLEVGTVTLAEEHELLLTDDGARAAAEGIFDGLASWFAKRDLGGRVALDGSAPGSVPEPRAGTGPPFTAEPMPDGPLRLRVTNTGTRPWEPGARVLAGHVADGSPYVYGVPDGVAPVGPSLPALPPGASAVVEVETPVGTGGEGLAWFSLLVEEENLAQHGSPALQLLTGAR